MDTFCLVCGNCAIFVTADHSWFGKAAAIVIFASGVLVVGFLQNLKKAVFFASPEGILLGGRRHRLDIPWRAIREVRISSTAHGARVDIVVTTRTRLARRRLPLIAEVPLGLVFPNLTRFIPPPLLAPVKNPAGYRVPLWGTTADHVAEKLRSLAPESVPIVRPARS